MQKYQGEGERRWIDQLTHEIEKAMAEKRSYTTPFLNPLRRKIAEEVLATYPQAEHLLFGGYPGAQRVRLSLWPADTPSVSSFPPVTAVRIQGQLEGQLDIKQMHERDVLGSLMEMGLSRDALGDLIWDSTGSMLQIIVNPDQVNLVLNMQRLEDRPIYGEEIPLEELEVTPGKSKEIKGTVASLRLDSVISLGLGVSRSRASQLAKSGQVLVNYRKETSPSHKLLLGDVISITPGGSNLQILSLEGESRKNRQRISLKKFYL